MLNDILESCNFVTENSKEVKVNYERIETLIKEIEQSKNTHYLTTSPFGIMDLSIEECINFLLLYDSIDFSFWGNPKWTISTEDGELDGGIALLYSLLTLFRKIGGNNIFSYLKDINFGEFKLLLKGNIEIPLLEERYNILKNIANIVISKMNGNFYEYIKGINSDKELFNIIIDNFENFKDERTYKEQTIYFYKLAQLLTSDILHILNFKENMAVNYSNLIGCADYKIPQVLRALEILEYSDELENIVDNKIEISENSTYEIEIRANMIMVIDYIYNKLNKKISRIDINDFIWLKGQDKSLKFKPYHLTRTVSY